MNKRQPFLSDDFLVSNLPTPFYDTDLENFWTQKSKYLFVFEFLFKQIINSFCLENFLDKNEDKLEETLNQFELNVNIQSQKFKVKIIKFKKI